mmetsp:Transcript_924/g.2302  ORF Transcript_924/g.2302 Transcript_924/m.2302 type:complete len:139 (+) Transcript_924:249-665(+)
MPRRTIVIMAGERRVKFVDEVSNSKVDCVAEAAAKSVRGNMTENEAKALRARQCAMEAMQYARNLKTEIRSATGHPQSAPKAGPPQWSPKAKIDATTSKSTSKPMNNQSDSDSEDVLGISLDWLSNALTILRVPSTNS